MEVQYYTLNQIPDFTMAKYSAQEGGSIDDILKQHGIFYRQLHRRGLLFRETYTLLYQYDPQRAPGKKLRIFFRIENRNKIALMDQFIHSTALSAGFSMEKCNIEKNCDTAGYPCTVILCKKSGTVSSSLPGGGGYYVVDEWKSNEKGRLMGLFRLMRALDRRCAYSVRLCPADLTESYRNVLQKQAQWMKPAGAGLGSAAQRDENAEKCIRLYNDLTDKLRGNPHFYCEITAWADDLETAKLVLDAAAAEAVEEGNYQVFSIRNGEERTDPLRPRPLYIPKGSGAPEGLEYWHALFLLKEVVPLACLPVLYPGESIEIPKETAPNYEKNGVHLGKDRQGYDVYVPWNLLPKHALLAGVPGSGKTNAMLYIASQLSGREKRLPILVLEPAKQEYRALVQNPDVYDLTVFAPGGSGSFPLRINPFEFPQGMKLSEHIVNLRQVFIGAFDLEAPMPFLLDQGIENVYRSCGWYPFDYNDFDENGRNKKPYPNMQMLFDEVEKLLNASDYAEEVRSNLKTVLQVRIGSLVSRETGNVFNVPASTFRPEEWLRHSCVLELESLGKDAANFLTLLLATIIRELLKQNPHSDTSPRHVIFFEEAHNLIGPSSEATQNNGNAKVASTKFIVDMLAEVRALEESIIIADQLPTALAPQVTKNTSLKIGLRITAQDDREMLASTMSADGVQLEQMALFRPGHALCLYEGVQKPFEIKIGSYPGISKSPDNDTLYALQSKNSTYVECMRRDMQIMCRKLELRKNALIDRWEVYRDTGVEFNELKNLVWSMKDAAKRQEKLKAWKEKMEWLYEKKKKVLRDHLELVLEFGEYVRMNRLMRQEGVACLAEEQNAFMSCVDLCDNVPSYSLELLKQQASVELETMWINLRTKR